MKIIDIVDNKVIIKPEALCIEPFSTIWESDKDPTKKNAIDKIRYIWFYCDYESPYFKNYPENLRGKSIVKDAIRDKSFKITKDVEDGVKKYTELHTTPEMRMIDGANLMIHRMETFFREAEIDGENIKKVTDSIIAIPKLVQALKDARKAARADGDSGTKIRGNADIGMYED